MSRPEPPEYVEGWGELIRAHRMLMGVSQRTLARRLQMSERSLSDIEVGRRNCPPGFLDAVERVVKEFDTDVDRAIRAGADAVAEQSDELSRIRIELSDTPDAEWNRAVVGRAAVEGRVLLPQLVRKFPEDSTVALQAAAR